MPAWAEYKHAAKERGALALELFVVQSTPAVAPEEMKKVLPGHLAYQRRMEEQGLLVFAGPMSDLSGEQMQGEGMIVYRAETMDAARALAEGDPMHATGSRTFTLRRWLVNEGSFTVSVGLSTKQVGFL